MGRGLRVGLTGFFVLLGLVVDDSIDEGFTCGALDDALGFTDAEALGVALDNSIESLLVRERTTIINTAIPTKMSNDLFCFSTINPFTSVSCKLRHFG